MTMVLCSLSPRPSCLLLLLSFYLVSCTRICSAFLVIPRQQLQFTTGAKQEVGFPRRVLFGGNTINTAAWTPSLLYTSQRNQDDKDDVSINQFTSTSNTNKSDIRKQEYQKTIEEMQRKRFDRAANKTSTPQELVKLGILCCFALLLIVLALKSVMPE
jgi:hypothetical protein